ncbi:hypothetical protein E0H22_05475 [Rhodopseudomonas boonkerdii]|uniref:DUF2946 family protein n=1 Tax=Rhodopseudomonas boonkerdii TaxID=475937 RepID=UPI001E621E49|nr:DUF2946 family protein [Rhodopseudomonas boonkerdii]UGV25175.1 hypothetical protein E0H22_05475 [Rhodopseudomonas boonkerdii]
MTHGSRKRWFGAVASLAAVYALVLNVVLSSLILASISPAAQAAGLELCLTHPDLAASPGTDGKTTGAPAVHCPACVGTHAPGTPPTSVTFSISRIAIAMAPIVAHNDRIVARTATSDHRARAPPQLS